MKFSKKYLLENVRLNIELCNEMMNKTKSGVKASLLNRAISDLQNAEIKISTVIQDEND